MCVLTHRLPPKLISSGMVWVVFTAWSPIDVVVAKVYRSSNIAARARARQRIYAPRQVFLCPLSLKVSPYPLPLPSLPERRHKNFDSGP